MSTEPLATDTALAARLRRPTTRKLGWNPAFDGTRGVGVVLVISFHFLGSKYFEGAPILVDLFFTLSGFLITTLLFEERAKRGAISFRDFYLRRVFRLFPAVYALLALFLVGSLIFGGKHRGELLAEFFAAAFYVYDILVAWVGVEGQVLVQLWTLSLEEQFYFVWPLLVIAALKTAKAGRIRALATGMVAVVVIMPALRMLLDPVLGARTFESFVFGISILRPDSLVLGCLGAMLWRLEPTLQSPRWDRVLSTGGNVALIMLMMTLLLGGFSAFQPFISPFYNLTVVVLPLWVLDLSRRPDTRLAQLLGHPVCRWFGKRSYGIYIWHLLIYFPIQAFFNDVFDRPKVATLAAFPFAFAGTIGVAVLSWNYIETPALRYKQRFARMTD